jgi:L-amino acid N-acyltransferase YncA
MTDIQVRALEAEDWPHVQRIYREGIATGHAAFESEPPTGTRSTPANTLGSTATAVLPVLTCLW